MEHYPKFQWTLSSDGTQQWVVRAETHDELMEAVHCLLSIISIEEESSQDNTTEETKEQPLSESTEEPPILKLYRQPVCPIHKKPMKVRANKNGEEWFDHRWVEGTLWHQCNGKTVRTNPIKKGS